eukprot:99194-Prymnesium_polylepis.1
MTAISPSHHSSIIHQHHTAHGTARHDATWRETCPRHGRDTSRHARDTAATRPRHVATCLRHGRDTATTWCDVQRLFAT